MKIMKCDIAVPLTGFLYAPDGPVVHTGRFGEKKKPRVEDSRSGANFMHQTVRWSHRTVQWSTTGCSRQRRRDRSRLNFERTRWSVVYIGCSGPRATSTQDCRW
ncbi:hypothetical protein PVAP13_8KG243600 [Panicum virgatum]|uniref:Uncharacterized protein n=1 Tax=Panicum virgatum TaxID=38727 RepID=A0A8T0PZJ2_PANVG|nr:hypothetical protein PVAP13_8KG243600 [Panicum virgatum]